MDPLSITASVVGLASSVTALSIRINEFTSDFRDAAADVEGVSRELADMTMILQKLRNETSTSISLPNHLQRDLDQVLRNCNRSVVEMDVFLKKASTRKMKSMSWAFSGKKECMNICRAIEAHKSTINITLALSSMYVFNFHGYIDYICDISSTGSPVILSKTGLMKSSMVFERSGLSYHLMIVLSC